MHRAWSLNSQGASEDQQGLPCWQEHSVVVVYYYGDHHDEDDDGHVDVQTEGLIELVVPYEQVEWAHQIVQAVQVEQAEQVVRAEQVEREHIVELHHEDLGVVGDGPCGVADGDDAAGGVVDDVAGEHQKVDHEQGAFGCAVGRKAER